jgi:superfamily II DNA or RNA helicase
MTDSNLQKIELHYKQGLLTATGGGLESQEGHPLREFFLKDSRTLLWSAPAKNYRDAILCLVKEQIFFLDSAKQYDKLLLPLKEPIKPRRHQTEALDAWSKSQRIGVVSLPTGAGKTILAMMAMHLCARPTLIVVPTIDLMYQWLGVVKRYFAVEPGLLGGGSHEISSITISTYDSAAIHAERLGARFGLVVFDECHHLPSPQYSMIAMTSLAPFRLGLSATVERIDGKEELIYDLIGPKIYEGVIHDLEEKTLSPYDVVQIPVEMNEAEWAQWSEARAKYKDFLRRHRINFSEGRGWQDFLIAVARQPDGSAAMDAYRAQKKLAQSSSAKITELWNIIKKHSGERIIVFTDDNDTAYRVGREFVVPVLTHHTKPKERQLILDEFRSGRIKIIATSKVLNEGVDVPEASVGVVVSGSGAVREHVQRLGRILRHQPGKRATLYEIISRGTGEHSTSERRRQHYAYQRPSTIYAPQG